MTAVAERRRCLEYLTADRERRCGDLMGNRPVPSIGAGSVGETSLGLD